MATREISRREFIGISAGAAAGAALSGSGMATFLADRESRKPRS